MEDEYILVKTMNDKIVILLSKKKAFIALIGSILFIVSGCLMIIDPVKFISPICGNPEVVRATGIAAVCFFGLCLIFVSVKLFDNKPGLIIGQCGITDNTNATSVGLVEWEDITEIEKKQVMSTAFLLLHTDNSEKYINRAKNVIARRALNINLKIYGTPLTIISNSLKINFDDLEKLVRSEFAKRKGCS